LKEFAPEDSAHEPKIYTRSPTFFEETDAASDGYSNTENDRTLEDDRNTYGGHESHSEKDKVDKLKKDGYKAVKNTEEEFRNLLLENAHEYGGHMVETPRHESHSEEDKVDKIKINVAAEAHEGGVSVTVAVLSTLGGVMFTLTCSCVSIKQIQLLKNA
jgi:hypothetical protein